MSAKILIISGNPENSGLILKTLETLFGQGGYVSQLHNFDTVHTEVESFECFNDWDAVIVDRDIGVPGVSGIYFADKIKHSASQPLVVIMGDVNAVEAVGYAGRILPTPRVEMTFGERMAVARDVFAGLLAMPAPIRQGNSMTTAKPGESAIANRELLARPGVTG